MIDSPQNQHVKLFRSLVEAKHRRETGLFALEGRRLIEEALKAKAELVWAAYSPDKFVGPEADRLLHALMQTGVELHEITPRALAAMSHTETPPGIAAVAKMVASRESRVASGQTAPERYWHLGLWEIRDPGNMGSMVRIAHAFGAAAVIAIGDCVDFWDPKVVRASVGSVMWVPLVEVGGLENLRLFLAADGRDPVDRRDACPTGRAGVSPAHLPPPGETASPPGPLPEGRGWRIAIVAADMAAPVACDEAEYPERCLLLVGSEAHGLPEEALALADLRVSIPMPGGAESLNAAVAAGIVAFEISRNVRR
jgi:TrmH family RNA methyltransferase